MIFIDEKILEYSIKNSDPPSNLLNDLERETNLKILQPRMLSGNFQGRFLSFLSKILKPNGVLVSKLFMGDDFLEVKELAKSRFKKVDFFKPEASRNESKETYLHCVTLRTL